MQRAISFPVVFAMLGLVAACDSDPVGVGGDYAPRNLESDYTWVLERWDQGNAQGHPVVQLTWEIPARYDEEAFRVYARGASGGYILIATVTSCSAGVCTYSDTNVEHGETYDYYIATVDDGDGAELGTSDAISVQVPARGTLTAPAAPRATALDGAVFLSWSATGAQRYLILSALENGESFLVGETDGTSYLDDRAENGTRARYYLAAVDEDDHVSGLSPSVDAFPRPDYHSEIVASHTDDPASSGFRFVTNPVTEVPIVAGTAPTAQWRLVESAGVLRIEPLGTTQVTAGTFTTQLTCGPGSEADCVDVRTAPTTGYSAASVPIQAGYTYVFRLTDSSARIRYAKIRVQGATVDSDADRVVIFDWAYQTRADERSLNLSPYRP